MKKALSIVLIALVAITAVFAQAASETQAEGGSGELILYTTVSQAHYDIAIAKFNELYPNIKVYYTYGGAGDCKARIQAEASNPQADAMFGGLQYADLAAYGDYFETYGCRKVTTTHLASSHSTTSRFLVLSSTMHLRRSLALRLQDGTPFLIQLSMARLSCPTQHHPLLHGTTFSAFSPTLAVGRARKLGTTLQNLCKTVLS